MAKFNSSTFNQLSGKVGGQVFRTTKNGLVVGGKPSTNRKLNLYTTAWRGRVSYLSSRWKTLTDAERNSWYAQVNGKESAFQLFCKFNLNAIGGFVTDTTSFVRVFPPVVQLPQLTPSTASIVAGGAKSVTVTCFADSFANWAVQCQATSVRSRGVVRNGSRLFKNMVRPAMSGSTVCSFSTAYNTYYGSLAGCRGDIVWVRVRGVHRVYGWATPWVYRFVIIS